MCKKKVIFGYIRQHLVQRKTNKNKKKRGKSKLRLVNTDIFGLKMKCQCYLHLDSRSDTFLKLNLVDTCPRGETQLQIM